MNAITRGLVTLFTVAVVGRTTAAAQARGDSAGVLELSATAVRYAKPTMAVVVLRLTATGDSLAAARLALEGTLAKLRVALIGAGLPKDSLQGSSRWDRWRGRVERLQAGPRCKRKSPTDPNCDMVHGDSLVRISDDLELRIHDLSLVPGVLDTAFAHGIADYAPIDFGADGLGRLRAEALEEAASLVRQRAEVLARASKARLGRTLNLTATDQSELGGRFGPLFEFTGVRPPAGWNVGSVDPRVPVKIVVTGRWELLPVRE